VSSTLHRDDLAQALEENWILLHYQPKVSLKTGTVAGFEGLVRLLHPVRGIVGPDQFIGLAEECGLIGPLTDRVVDLGLQQLADWSRAGLKTKVSLNLSATVLADLELPDRMSARALSLGLEPAQVILEITETGAFRDSADTLEILARLHMKGFALSIDDFGTGYSSLDQLRRVPFSELKIDRAFVHGAAESAKARAILRSSAELGRSLGMSVVAEGAEDDADLSALVDDRVDMVQGYVFSRPLAAVDALPWSARWAQQGTHLTRR
jgi:EAL domain-containing protein (putative c-di-GMP-specific phosphodiesterase class I)